MGENKSTLENKMTGVNSEFIMKINDLNNEIEDLKLVVATKDAEIDKYKDLIGKKNREINELNQAKIDFKFVVTKNEELKIELEELRQKLNVDSYNTYEQQIKIEEMEIISKTQKSIQNKNNEVAKLEFDNLQSRFEEMIKVNKNLMTDNKRLSDEAQNLRKINEDLRDKNNKLHSGHTTELEKLQAKVKERDAQIKVLTTDITGYQAQVDKISSDSLNKDLRLKSLEERIRQLEKKNSMIMDSGIIEPDAKDDEIENISMVNQSLAERRDELSKINFIMLML